MPVPPVDGSKVNSPGFNDCGVGDALVLVGAGADTSEEGFGAAQDVARRAMASAATDRFKTSPGCS